MNKIKNITKQNKQKNDRKNRYNIKSNNTKK